MHASALSVVPAVSLILALCGPALVVGGCTSADDDVGGLDVGTEGDGDGDGATSGDEAGNASEGDDGAPARSGEELYLGICAACHGVEGEGTGLGYELRHPTRDYAEWVVRNGRPGDEFEGSQMLAYGEAVLSDAELEGIWDYLDTFPVPEDGVGLYVDYCGNCHGADASGGVVGVDIRDKEFGDISEKVRKGIGLSNPGGRVTYMPQFGGDDLSDGQIQAIADVIGDL